MQEENTSGEAPQVPKPLVFGGQMPTGLTVRDYVAVAVLQGLIANPERYKYIADKVAAGMSNAEATEKNVRKAFLMADAFLAERSKEPRTTVIDRNALFNQFIDSIPDEGQIPDHIWAQVFEIGMIRFGLRTDNLGHLVFEHPIGALAVGFRYLIVASREDDVKRHRLDVNIVEGGRFAWDTSEDRLAPNTFYSFVALGVHK